MPETVKQVRQLGNYEMCFVTKLKKKMFRNENTSSITKICFVMEDVNVITEFCQKPQEKITTRTFALQRRLQKQEMKAFMSWGQTVSEKAVGAISNHNNLNM